VNSLSSNSSSSNISLSNLYFSFNNWKYVQLAKRETSNKKRKLEPQVTTETVPESQSIEIVAQP